MMQTFLSTPTPTALRIRSPALPSPVTVDLAPPTPPLLPPPCLPVLPTSQTARDDASDLTEEIRRSLENLDAIIQLHDDGGLTEQEMLNLPAPAPELLDFGEGSPQHCPFAASKPPPPPAPPRRSSIKQNCDLIPDNGHAMTEEEEAGIDQSSRSVADILQKFSRANTPPKVPTVPPALRSKSISCTRDPPDVVPPPAAFRSPEPSCSSPAPVADPSPPPPPPPPPPEEEADTEDFGFARLRKLAELSSKTGEDVHKKGILQRSKTVDVSHSTPSYPPPELEERPASQYDAPHHDTRRASAPDNEEAERESFAFARLRALAEQSSGAPGNEDSDSVNDSDNDLEIDLSQVPGYTRIDSRCPNWKRGMVEKKNKEAIEAYLKAKEEEEKERRKWANVPAWKRNLVQKKQADKRPEDMPGKGGTGDDGDLPSWKRNLVQRRKSSDVESRR